jgi:hypothetical protein
VWMTAATRPSCKMLLPWCQSHASSQVSCTLLHDGLSRSLQRRTVTCYCVMRTLSCSVHKLYAAKLPQAFALSLHGTKSAHTPSAALTCLFKLPACKLHHHPSCRGNAAGTSTAANSHICHCVSRFQLLLRNNTLLQTHCTYWHMAAMPRSTGCCPRR